LNTDNKVLLLLTGGIWQKEIIQEAKRKNCIVYLVDKDKDCFCRNLCDKFFEHDVQDYQGLISKLKNEKIDGILSEQTDVAVVSGAHLCKYFNLQGLSIYQAEILTNKFQMREFCKSNKIPIPKYHSIETLEEAYINAKKISFPVIIKPSDNQSSRGVTKVWQEENIESAFNLAMKYSISKKVLIEELLVGYESSVEMYVTDKKIHLLGISQKNKSFPPYSYDTKLIYPPDFQEEIQNSLSLVSEKIIKSLNLKSTLVHAEFIITPNGVYLLEIAGRGCGAGVITLLIPKITNFNPVQKRIMDALKEKQPEPQIKTYIKTGILDFLEYPEGQVESISGIENAKKIPGVIDIKINFKVGDHLRYPTNGGERHGSLHVIGNHKQEAEQNAYNAKKEIIVKLK